MTQAKLLLTLPVVCTAYSSNDTLPLEKPGIGSVEHQHAALSTCYSDRDHVAAQADLYRAAEAAARAAEVFGPGDLIAVDGSAMDRLFVVREGSCCEIEVRVGRTARPCVAAAHVPCTASPGGPTTGYT